MKLAKVAYLIVPYLDQPVISARDEVRLVTPAVVVYGVYPLLMPFQGEVRGR